MRTGVVDYLTQADAVGFFLGTCPGLGPTHNMLPLVGIQWTHRRKFRRKCPHEGRHHRQDLWQPQERPDTVEECLHWRSPYLRLRTHADRVWNMASLLE